MATTAGNISTMSNGFDRMRRTLPPINRPGPEESKAEEAALKLIEYYRTMTPEEFQATYGNRTDPAWQGNMWHAHKLWKDSKMDIHHWHQLESLIQCVTYTFIA